MLQKKEKKEAHHRANKKRIRRAEMPQKPKKKKEGSDPSSSLPQWEVTSSKRKPEPRALSSSEMLTVARWAWTPYPMSPRRIIGDG